MTSNRGLSCIVISSASEKSFSFAVRRSMTGNTNGKPAPQERFGHRPFYTRCEAPLCLAFPIGEGGPRSGGQGALVNRLLETLLPTFFHSASAPSAPSGHLPLEGKADDTGIPSSKIQRSRHLNLLNPEPAQPDTPFLDFRSTFSLISFCELHIINSMLFYHR